MKKSELSLLYKTMGALKIAMLFSIIFAAFSSVLYIQAFTYVYQIAGEIIKKLNNLSDIDKGLLSALAKKILFSICGGYGFYGISLFFSHLTAFNTASRLKIKVIKHIGTLPLGFFDTHPSGALRKIIEKNTEMAETLIAHQIPNTTQSIVLPIAFAFFIFRYSAALSVACIIPVVIGFILMMLIMSKGGSDFVQKYQRAQEDMSNAAVEYVRGISVVKTFGQSAESFNRYKNSVESFSDYVLKFALSMKTGDSLYNSALNSLFLTLIPVTLLQFNKASEFNEAAHIIMTFVFFASLLPIAVSILKKMMSNKSESVIAGEAMAALQKILDEKPMDYVGSETPFSYDIQLKNVSFRYSEDLPFAIEDFNLELKEGSVTAFVGMSGGGKSTLGSLVARFWDCTKGEILIGGVDVKKISREKLNSLVSVVFQENSLLKKSLRENVALYKPDASDEEILEALKAARCSDILARLPNGLDTVYGSKGVYFSGGELQRIAIARAVLKNSPIVILDEATAFSDSENEYLIRMALKELLKGKTVIMIAHRMSTVTDADQICVIENGRLAEKGTHSQLLEKGGIYKNMTDEYNKAVSWKFGGKK